MHPPACLAHCSPRLHDPDVGRIEWPRGVCTVELGCSVTGESGQAFYAGGIEKRRSTAEGQVVHAPVDVIDQHSHSCHLFDGSTDGLNVVI